MSEADWLGYTPMAKGAVNHMKSLWQSQALPDEPDFSQWSVEYSRDIYELVMIFAEIGREELILALHNEGVWDEDPATQRWRPKVG